MIYPRRLVRGDAIGVAAPSGGVTKEADIRRFANGKQRLEEMGLEVCFGSHVFTEGTRGRSAGARERAEDMNRMLADPKIRAVVSAKGGDYLMEILDQVDMGALTRDPKWFQGFSDNTGLVHFITTKYEIAAIYGANFGDFGMEPWQRSVTESLGVLQGTIQEQKSFSHCENTFHDRVTGLEGYAKDAAVCYQNARGEERLTLHGRMLGGCLDVLSFLAGTRYDGTADFCEKYQQDGILWYLESFATSAEQLITTLWQLREMGWFRYCSGIVFGRPCFYQTEDYPYREAAMEILGDLAVPMVFDADIGHRGPQFSVINGALGTLISERGRGLLRWECR